jgi:hypothetical protein
VCHDRSVGRSGCRAWGHRPEPTPPQAPAAAPLIKNARRLTAGTRRAPPCSLPGAKPHCTCAAHVGRGNPCAGHCLVPMGPFPSAIGPCMTGLMCYNPLAPNEGERVVSQLPGVRGLRPSREDLLTLARVMSITAPCVGRKGCDESPRYVCCYQPGLAFAENVDSAASRGSQVLEALSPRIARPRDGSPADQIRALFVRKDQRRPAGAATARPVPWHPEQAETGSAHPLPEHVLAVGPCEAYQLREEKAACESSLECWQPFCVWMAGHGDRQDAVVAPLDKPPDASQQRPPSNLGCVFLERSGGSLQPTGRCLLQPTTAHDPIGSSKPVGCLLHSCKVERRVQHMAISTAVHVLGLAHL